MRKPERQAVAGIHGKNYKRRLDSFIQLGHNQIQVEAAFGDSIAAFDSVALARIFVHLALKLNVRFIGTSAA